jgi:hypothetical protein
MKETFSCNVQTRYGDVFVVIDKDAIKPNDPESGLTVEVGRRSRVPNVSGKVFVDLSVKFLLGLYPNVDSSPSPYSHTYASMIMRRKLAYIEHVIASQFVM